MKKILFQGDSITDFYRENGLGKGYAMLVAAELGYEYPGEYEFINRGVGGNRIVDLYARIKTDIINLKPDCISILIGVNDVWHELSWQNGVDAEKFEKIYSMLIEEIKEALPEVRIMIMEPFCLKGRVTDDTEEYPNKWNVFRAEVEERARKAKMIAERYELSFVALQDRFDEACQKEKSTYWLEDGVHPTEQGHELIKRAWIEAYNNKQ